MAPGSRLQDLTAKYMQNPRRFFVPLANEHLRSGDLDGAIALCREHLPAQPGHMSGHIVLGRAYFEKGDLDAARDVFLTSVSLDDENLIALRHLGDIARGRNEIDEARGWYARVLDADPQNAEIEALLRSLDAVPSAPVEFEAPAEPDFLTLTASEAAGPTGAAPELGSALADPTPPGLRAILGETDLPGFDPGLVRGTDPMPPSAVRTLETFDLSTLGDDSATSADDGIAGDATGVEFVADAGAGSAAADSGIHAEEGVGFGFEDLDSQVDPSAPSPAPDALPAMRAADFPTTLDTPSASTSVRPTPSDEVMARPGFGALASFASWRTAQERDTPTYQAAQKAPTEPPAAEPPTDDAPGELFWDDRSPETAPTAPEFVTETMASLYQQQGFTQQALDVYRALLARTPNDPSLSRKVQELEALLSAPVDETALEDDADKALQFDDLGSDSSGPADTQSMLEAMYDVSPPSEPADAFGASWAPPGGGDDWFAPDAELDPIGEPMAGPGEMFGLQLEGFASERDASGAPDPFSGASAGRGGVVLESVFGTPTVATADEAAADMMVRIASQMVGRLPKEAPTLPVPEVLELPSAVAGDQATGASPAPLLSFDRFFSGSGSPPRARIDTPVRPAGPPREIVPPAMPPSPSLSPTFGGVPVIPPPRSTPAPNWAGFDQFLAPAAATPSPAPSVTPPSEPPRPAAPVQPGAFWTPPDLPTQAPTATPVPTPAPVSARPTPAPVPPPVVPPPAPTEPEPPRAAPSEFHRWLEGLS